MTRAVAVLILLFTSCTCYGSPAEEIYRRSVLVEIGTPQAPLGSCSGVILRTDLVLTAAHCAVGDTFRVDGKEASVVKIDKATDLLLLKTRTERFRMVTFGKVVMAQDVMAAPDFGPPFNRILFFGRVASLPNGHIWSDLKAAPGFSGSGLFDLDGRLVGLNNQFLLHQSDIAVVLCAVSVPSDVIREFLKGADSK
jgi:S1-C subfamily serine protease